MTEGAGGGDAGGPKRQQAEELVEQWGGRLVTATARLVARAREEAEDMVSESQALRRSRADDKHDA